MMKTLTFTALVMGTFLMVLAPGVAMARDHGNSSGRSGRIDRGGRGFSGGRNYAPRGFSGGYSGRQNFVSPPRYDRGRSSVYIAPRSYGRPFYRGYSGGAYFGYSAPYGYAYTPGYAYAPAVPQPQTCAEGYYDRYGNWIPNPNCYPAQPQYQQQQQSYDSYPQQAPQQPPQNYNDDQQQQYGPPPQQRDYDPNQQYPQQRQNYDPNQQPYDR